MSFITDVLSSAGMLAKDDLVTKIIKLRKNIESLVIQVQETMECRYITFIPSFNETVELEMKVSNFSIEVQSLKDTILNEIPTKTHLPKAEIQELSEQLQKLKEVLQMIEKILKVHEKLDLASQQLGKKDYYSSTLILEEINILLTECKPFCQSFIKILHTFKYEYFVRKEKLTYDVGEFWNENLVFSFQTNEKEQVNTVQLRISIPDPEKMEEFRNLLNAMQNLKYLESKLGVFAKSFMDRICIPLLKYHGQVAQRLETKTIILEVAVFTNERKTLPYPDEVFYNLTTIFDFLNKTVMQIIIITENDSPVKLMRKWGDLMSKNFCDVIIKESLSKAVPSHKKDLEKFNKIIEETINFQKTLVEFEFFSEEERSLVAYVENVNVLFADKKCHGLLERARHLMMKDLHVALDFQDSSDPNPIEAVKLINGSPPPEVGSSNIKLSACKISDFTILLVTMAYEILLEAIKDTSCSVRMFYSVRKLFELYCDVVPVFHHENLEKFPQQTALHHNNCMYIAHHLSTMGHYFRFTLPEPLKDNFTTFVDLIPRFQKLRTEVFLSQMRIQKKILIGILEEIGGFQRMAEETNFMENLERALKKCLHQLSSLQRDWQNVLPANIYFKAIGTLLNSLLEEIIAKITTQQDIPSDCTVQLMAVFGMLIFKAPTLFSIDNNNNRSEAEIHSFVPKWIKFRELMLILGASMKDIVERWDNGKGPLAHEFSTSEVKQLIRALFKDTDGRAAVLIKIK